MVRLNQLLSKEDRDRCDSLTSYFCFVTGINGVLLILVAVLVGYIRLLSKLGPQSAFETFVQLVVDVEIVERTPNEWFSTRIAS